MPRTMIAIPSYGRYQNITFAPVNSATYVTAPYISKTYWPHTRYYVEPEEVKEYRKVLDCKGGMVKTTKEVEYPKQWGSIMDLIIDECCPLCDQLIIMDDDLRLSYRPKLPEEPTTFEPMSGKVFDLMVAELRTLNKKFPLTSGQYRLFSNGKTEQYQYNQRLSMIWSLNSKFFVDNPQFRFYRPCKLDFMSDYYFFMSLLCAGHGNVCINRFTKDDKPNAKGGEQSKRTHDIFNKAVLKFAEMFPKYVKTKPKKDKGHWEDGMLGVTIQAAKAYKDSQSMV